MLLSDGCKMLPAPSGDPGEDAKNTGFICILPTPGQGHLSEMSFKDTDRTPLILWVE